MSTMTRQRLVHEREQVVADDRAVFHQVDGQRIGGAVARERRGSRFGGHGVAPVDGRVFTTLMMPAGGKALGAGGFEAPCQ
jgi:hypothetical protein